MRVVVTIEDSVVIRKILTHLGLQTEASAPRLPPSDPFDWSGVSATGVTLVALTLWVRPPFRIWCLLAAGLPPDARPGAAGETAPASRPADCALRRYERAASW